MSTAFFIIECVLALHIIIPLVCIFASVCIKMLNIYLTTPSFRYQPVAMSEPLLTEYSNQVV